MEKNQTVRIDKYLWAVRLFKTRSIATEACKKGKILIDNMPVKSSRMIKKGDVISIKEPPITKQYKVLDISAKRMGAKLTPDFIKDITPEEELEILRITNLANQLNRPRGMGRPTKKDRRDIDHLFNSDKNI